MAQKQQRNISGIFLILFVTILMFLSINIFKNNIYSDNNDLWKKWVNGQATQKIETAYNKESPLAQISKNIWTYLHFYLFGQARNQKILIETHEGDTWLFTSEEYDIPKNANKHYQENMAYIRHVATQLQAENISLQIILIPAKTRLFASKTKPALLRQNLYQETLATLSQEQIAVTPALHVLQNRPEQKTFFQYDTHWTPVGAAIVAEKTAQDIEAKIADLPKTNFTREKQENLTHHGDLLRYLPFTNLKKHGFTDEAYEAYHYEAITRDIDAASLFGDTELPIALVGTSYSANNIWQFEAALKYALQIDIMNLATEGFGPFHAMKTALESDFMQETPPSLIIWEIPERYLLYPNGQVTQK